jgi:hypothetical protein
MTEDGESYEITPWAAHIGRWAIYVRPSNDRGNAVDSFHHADDLQEPDKLELRADGRVFFTTEREYIEALPVNALPPTQVRNCHSSAKILGPTYSAALRHGRRGVFPFGSTPSDAAIVRCCRAVVGRLATTTPRASGR